MIDDATPLYGHRPRRLCTVRQIPNQPGYEWTSQSFLRHAIFNAEDRVGSGGTIIPGNGLSGAILRLGRKVLIDLDEFDEWVNAHRDTKRGGS